VNLQDVVGQARSRRLNSGTVFAERVCRTERPVATPTLPGVNDLNTTSRTTIRLVLLLACCAMVSPARGEWLYVSLETADQVVAYDISLSSSAAVQASRQVFASTNLSNPYGLAFDTAGNLYVANVSGNTSTYANTISKFDSAGTFVLSMSRPGWHNPIDVAFDSSGTLYVCNESSPNNYSIAKFNTSGTFLGNFGSNPNPAIAAPGGLAFDTSGNLYVTSYDNETLVKFNSAGSIVSTSTTGVGSPYDVAFGAGSLYVANSFSPENIAKFSTSTTLLGTIGSSIGSGFLGVAIDGAGNVYGSTGSDIYKFDSAGVLQFSWPTPGDSTYMAVAAVVPEPPTYAMAFAGLACGCFSMWRRRKPA